MLVPAILFKEQIITEFQRIYYTEDMMYLTGCLEQERGQRLFFDFSKNTNPNIGTVEDNIMKAARGRVDLRRFKALTLEDILKAENSYNISYLN